MILFVFYLIMDPIDRSLILETRPYLVDEGNNLFYHKKYVGMNRLNIQ